MKKRILLLIFVLATPFFLVKSAFATVYFYYDAEDGTPGSYLPWYGDNESVTNEDFFPLCFWEGSCTEVSRGTVGNSVATPDGTNYANVFVPLTENTALHQLKNRSNLNFGMAEGSVIYLAYYHNSASVNGSDIWHETGQSAAKSMGIDGEGIRWSNTFGHWEDQAMINSPCYGVQDSFEDNDDHKYTVVIGNPTYHIQGNTGVPWETQQEPTGPNAGGYSCTNMPQFAYGEWHSFVMAVKLANEVPTGFVKFYIDGVLTHEYLNIPTVARSKAQYDANEPMKTSPFTFDYIEMVGTTSQGVPANDHPEHNRMFDKIMLTDNWQDIVDGGYISVETPTETCTDNIQNQDETGIDCGGVCEACIIPTTYNLTNFISAITNWLGIGNATSDVNSDGAVNTRDLGVMMSGWSN